MSYKKLIETKIVRTQHQVSFHIGNIVHSIAEDLKMVPPKAKLVDVNEESNILTLTFEIETAEEGK